jgi:biotin biosynthesis protein BioC
MAEWFLDVDKADLAERFGKAAPLYDHHALLQREVGDHLVSMLPPDRFSVSMDLGCGTGYFLPALAQRSDTVLGVDLASGMLGEAAKRNSGARLFCGDAEQLPIAANSLDLVYSTLALQWCASLPLALSEVFRVLRPGGYFAFATLIDGSLSELRAAWRDVDHQDHVNPFIRRETLQYLCDACGFKSSGWQERQHRLYFSSLSELLMSLKGIGASQVTGHKNSGLGGRNRLHLLDEAYKKKQSSCGELPLSYEVCYGVLTR